MAFFVLSKRRPLRLLSATDLAVEHDRLLEENQQLHRAMTSHAVIDQAIGALVALGRVTPEEAWRSLRDVSQHLNIKLRTVAEHVLAFAQGEELPEEQLDELKRALDRHRECPGGLPAGSPPTD
ncbi:ANTAR domain-containing protein [Streptomyces sp. NPDC005526]|uniref:ANTAR domain-containing protein n=1 Tax=Streptomyces sp. NPDC005526 TaxID=3156885 RepID=UPI0033B1864A